MRRAAARRTTGATRTARIAAASSAGLAALVVAGAPASAKTFHVTRSKDGGKGSLRKAVARADKRPGPDRILIERRIHQDIRLRRSLQVQTSVTLVGPGEDGPGLSAVAPKDHEKSYPYLSLDANGRRRAHFVVRNLALDSLALYAGDRASINHVTSTARPHPNREYVLIAAVGLFGKGPKTIRDVSIGAGWDEGISASGADVDVVDSQVTGQTGHGIGFYHASGTVEHSVISGVDGAGLDVDFGHADVVASTITGNAHHGIVAGYYGGVTLERSTVSGNSAVAGAGLVVTGYGSATVRNSTISDNTASSSDTHAGVGGGIWAGADARVEIEASTLTDNTADQGGGIYLHQPGPDYTDPITVKSSIVAGNQAGTDADCAAVEDYPGGPAQPVSEGGNVFGPDSCGTTGPGDVLTGDPKLGPLADNGGPTLTHALLPGSPAVGNGLDIGLATDQRGVARSNPDSGSFELQQAP
jgi:hypothetical protein